MKNDFNHLKKGIKITWIIMTVLLCICIIGFGVLISFARINWRNWQFTIPACLLIIVLLASLLSVIIGGIFLLSNRKIHDFKKVKKLEYLDWGIIYFYFANKIDIYLKNYTTDSERDINIEEINKININDINISKMNNSINDIKDIDN